MNRRAKSSAGNTRRSRAIAGVLAALALVITLTSCSAEEVTTHGTETEPLYGGEVFVTSETISFDSGESMSCYGREEQMEGAIFCEWEDAPLANIKLSEESAEKWELVFVDLNADTKVCITQYYGTASSEVLSCRETPVLR